MMNFEEFAKYLLDVELTKEQLEMVEKICEKKRDTEFRQEIIKEFKEKMK